MKLVEKFKTVTGLWVWIYYDFEHYVYYVSHSGSANGETFLTWDAAKEYAHRVF